MTADPFGLPLRDVSSPRVLPGVPPELLVYDRTSACPYLPDQIARMPLRLPARRLKREELDRRLSAGDRRQGYVLYRTHCSACAACIPLRIPTAQVRLSRSQRRVLRATGAACRTEIGEPRLSERRVELYNKHKLGRGLHDGQPPLTREAYREFLVHTCCDTFELRFYFEDVLAGVAIVDRGATALSAVYCCYDPAFSKWSLGTYSILKQLELCRSWRLEHLYLGLYVEDSAPMRYKAKFRPHERLIDGAWQSFGDSLPTAAQVDAPKEPGPL